MVLCSMRNFITAAVFTILSAPALAGEPQVVKVVANSNGSTWSFAVTLEHGDTGWDHYADGWGVFAPDGTELGYRVLAHPHVNEQPFTRSLQGVSIPAEIDTIIIRPNDLVHGNGPDFLVTLAR